MRYFPEGFNSKRPLSLLAIALLLSISTLLLGCDQQAPVSADDETTLLSDVLGSKVETPCEAANSWTVRKGLPPFSPNKSILQLDNSAVNSNAKECSYTYIMIADMSGGDGLTTFPALESTEEASDIGGAGAGALGRAVVKPGDEILFLATNGEGSVEMSSEATGFHKNLRVPDYAGTGTTSSFYAPTLPQSIRLVIDRINHAKDDFPFVVIIDVE